MSEILTISNLRHAASRIWTCAEPELCRTDTTLDLNHSDVLPFFTQHDRFFFLSDLSANKSNRKLFCFSMWHCKLLSLWGKVQLCSCKSIIKNCNKFIWSISFHLVFTILYYSFIYNYDVLWIVNFNFEFLDS